MHLSKRKKEFSLLGTGIGMASAGTVAFVCLQLHLNFAAAGFIQMLLVLIVALYAGFWEATIVSLVANACLDLLFVPPLYHFSVGDPQNWVALLVFEGAALLMSRVSIAARQQTSRAAHQRLDIEHLYRVSRQLLRLARESSPGPQIAELIQQVFSARSVVVFDAGREETSFAGEPNRLLESESRAAYLLKEDGTSSTARTVIKMLHLEAQPLGALGMQGVSMRPGTADALATLVGVTLESSRLFERVSRLAAEKQLESRRRADLDSLADAFETSLTTLRRAVAERLEVHDLGASQAEFLIFLDCQSTILKALTDQLRQVSRSEQPGVRLGTESTEMVALTDETVHDGGKCRA